MDPARGEADGSDYPSELLELDPLRRTVLLGLSAGMVHLYRLLRRRRVSFGHGVIANHRLVIRGPGMVTVGDRANLYAFAGRTSLVTRTRSAEIRIGSNTRLNGSLLQADTLIDIGPDCIIGQAHILDSDMHSLALDRRVNPGAPVRTAPVILERNVWVSRGAAILPGVRIGEGSVIGYGSVVTGDVPPRVVAAGNPARVVRSLE
jgi:carbonic anhydrase/acetyltransferase-like protein (isoleucine patch superfamily)